MEYHCLMMVSGSLGSTAGFPQFAAKRTLLGVPEPLDLYVKDLVLWTGKPTEYASMSRRVVYQVVERKDPADSTMYVQYRFRAVFDFENPVGTLVDPTGWMTAREMKKLSLLDLATLRLHFDNFIREWAKSVGEGNIDDVR